MYRRKIINKKTVRFIWPRSDGLTNQIYLTIVLSDYYSQALLAFSRMHSFWLFTKSSQQKPNWSKMLWLSFKTYTHIMTRIHDRRARICFPTFNA